MNLLEQPAEIRSMFAFWQLLRDLGFAADDIFVAHADGRLLLQVAGENGFSIALGYTRMPQSEFERRWVALAESTRSLDVEQVRANYNEFATPERAAQVLVALDAAGISAPNDPRRAHLN